MDEKAQKAKLSCDLWEHDLNSEERESGLAYGDNVWSLGKEGDPCWVSPVDENDGRFFLLTSKWEGTPTNEEVQLEGAWARDFAFTLAGIELNERL